MRFDKTITLVESVQQSDGMGGYEEVKIPFQTIKALTTTITVETAKREYGIVAKKTLKVFTKDSIPSDIGSVQIDDAQYSVVFLNDFGKRMKMLVVTRDN